MRHLYEEGNLIERFALQVADSIKAVREYSLETDYTVAGMDYKDNTLYVFSEAYSTVMALNLETKLVEQVYGIEGMRESAGIAIRGNRMYAIGDLENYIPEQACYIFAIE
jgi:FAD/FMN-containing dehydrogenase